jgi:hypothetical protein
MKSGFFAMEDPARTDYAMLMSTAFLLIVGGGRWSLDRRYSKPPHATLDEVQPASQQERP